MGNKNNGYTLGIPDSPTVHRKTNRSWKLTVNYCPNIEHITNECIIELTPTQILLKNKSKKIIKSISYYDLDRYGHKENILLLDISKNVCKFHSTSADEIVKEINIYIHQIYIEKVKVIQERKEKRHKANKYGIAINKSTGRPTKLDKRMFELMDNEGKKERKKTKKH
ncbi:hypothetical protein M0812_13942 [Anaeramoeba flamelloides]|uniref:Uncharacterized protein n=1 Tax=Anaeramoeba flamelloides TaxID=1746091 RepID=A0AAV7ZMM0_9EUKA|nr:hypothetical protein M0812_13942 [Anaeramoeba flamelloides]